MAVAAQGHHINHLVRRHTENFLDFGGIADQVVLWGIQHADAGADQLHHVLVAGDDEYRIAVIYCLPSQRADYVVGFEAGELEDGDARRRGRAGWTVICCARSSGIALRLAL